MIEMLLDTVPDRRERTASSYHAQKERSEQSRERFFKQKRRDVKSPCVEIVYLRFVEGREWPPEVLKCNKIESQNSTALVEYSSSIGKVGLESDDSEIDDLAHLASAVPHRIVP